MCLNAQNTAYDASGQIAYAVKLMRLTAKAHIRYSSMVIISLGIKWVKEFRRSQPMTLAHRLNDIRVVSVVPGDSVGKSDRLT